MTVAGLRVLEHHVTVYRHIWRGTFFTTLLAPVMFLGAMGFGLGMIVDARDPASLGGVPYLVFLAPGLVAAQAMQTGAIESTWPLMAGFKWLRTFEAIVASPQTPRDLVIGNLWWVILRLALVTGIFLIVATLFGAIRSPAAILAWPAAILTGLAFAAPLQAFTATQKTEGAFNNIFRFVLTPLYLFSGTFFPISQLPDFLQPVAYLTPLYHGVALTRGVALATITPVDALIHLGYLGATIAVGVALAFVTFRRRLIV